MKFVILENTTQPPGQSRFDFLMEHVTIEKDDFVIPAGKEDIFNYFDLRIFFEGGVIDFKRYKDGLKRCGEVDDLTWQGYEIWLQQEIAGNRACSDARMIEAFTQDLGEGPIFDENALDSALDQFDINSIASRRKRYTRVKTLFRKKVFIQDILTIINEIEAQSQLIYNYIENGLAGTLENDDIEALLNYLDATKLAYYPTPDNTIHGLYADSPNAIFVGVRDKALKDTLGVAMTQQDIDTLVDSALEVLCFGINGTKL